MDAEAGFSQRVSSQIRSPHPSQSPRPIPTAPPRRVQHVQHHNIPSTSYASEETFIAEFNVQEEIYQNPQSNFVKTGPHHSASLPTFQHAQPMDIPSTSCARTSSEDRFLADLDDQEYQDLQNNPSKVLIKIPENCKIFEYSLMRDGVKQILLIPMPSIATVNDVRDTLPGILNVDPSEIDCNMIKPHEVVEETEDGLLLPMSFNSTEDDSKKTLPKLLHVESSMMNNWSQQAVQEVESAEEYEEVDGEEKPRAPILVNPKQFRGIMRRREMRQKLEDDGRIPRTRSKYLHESRHRHALNRKRNTDGKFEGDAEEVDDEEVEDEAETDETAVTSTVPTVQYVAPTQYTQRYAPIAAAPHSQEMSYIQPIQQPPSNTQARYIQPLQQPTSSTQPSTSYGSGHYGHHQ